MLTPEIGVVITSRCNLEFIQLILPNQTIGFVNNNDCHNQIVFDTNSEQTLWQLENLEIHPKRMILTNNPCPEYVQDLQYYQPMAIICNPHTTVIQQAFQNMQLGQRTEIIPKNLANLNLKERIVLRLIAIGKSDKEISSQLGLADGSVRNIISKELLPKLQKTYPTHTLKNRKNLAQYYLGGMHFLREKDKKIPHSLIPMIQADQSRREKDTLRMYGFEPHEKEEAREFLQKIFVHNPRFFRTLYNIPEEPILPRTHRVKRSKLKI
jgi:hypothetical protein